jgi:DNA-binding IclR family transcriptional regulator
MGLDRALHALPDDRGTENTVREVLQLMSRHAGEWMRVTDVSRTLEHPESRITAILSTLAEGYVLLADGDRFRYERDPLVDLDIKRFLARSEAHNRFAQDNLARFRDRRGQY